MGRFWADTFQRADHMLRPIIEARIYHRREVKAFVFKQGADGVPVADFCRKAGLSQATYFNWKNGRESMQPPEMRRLKQLKGENSRLKKIDADLSLDREMLQDVIRYGKRRVHVLLCRGGWDVTIKKAYGIKRELGL